MSQPPTNQKEDVLEGVIRFQLSWNKNPLADDICLETLELVRSDMLRQQLIGQSAERYQGYGFGNISQRSEQGFIISGTQTGHLTQLARQGWCEVTDCDPMTGKVSATGPVKPSSEAMSHAIYYQLDPAINAVIHVHSPAMFNAASQLNLLATAADIEYGTTEMVTALQQLFLSCRPLIANEKDNSPNEKGNQPLLPHLAVMSGHEDGIICCGSSLQQASQKLTDILTLANALT
ncbi:class II aldolase/adducin family protein [Pelagibaculum spongiae]|nr:class II aldolase/adducin family protein [Pelagibaculum spongiae]